jgi:hypothetical protein
MNPARAEVVVLNTVATLATIKLFRKKRMNTASLKMVKKWSKYILVGSSLGGYMIASASVLRATLSIQNKGKITRIEQTSRKVYKAILFIVRRIAPFLAAAPIVRSIISFSRQPELHPCQDENKYQ